MKNSSILITGASGLIGRELIHQLIENGSTDLRAIDINDIDTPMPNVHFLKGDIGNAPESLFKGVNIVIHLASAIGVEYTEQNPLQTIETITNGTKKILELSRKHKVSRFVITSSSEVYGDISSRPLSEDSSVSPKSVYGSAKLTAEYLCRAFQKEFGLNYTILRIFNAFGKKQSNKFVIPLFTEKALKGEPLEIFGDGSQTRSFCHVSDVVKYIIKTIQLDSTKNNTYNIGDPRNNLSIHDLAIKILELTRNSNSTIKYIPGESVLNRNPEREIHHRRPDITAISAVTGYQPLENFTEKLLEIIDYKREFIRQSIKIEDGI